MTKWPRHGEKRIKIQNTPAKGEKTSVRHKVFFQWNLYHQRGRMEFQVCCLWLRMWRGALGKTLAWLSTLCGFQLREKMLPAWATSLKSDSCALEKYLLNTCVLGPGLSPENRRLGETATALLSRCWESSGGLRQKERDMPVGGTCSKGHHLSQEIMRRLT